MDAADTYTEVTDPLLAAGAKRVGMFGGRAMKISGKVFLCSFSGSVAFRLGRLNPAHAAALEVAGAALFDPSGKGQPFKDWVAIPEESSDAWPECAEAAMAHTRVLAES